MKKLLIFINIFLSAFVCAQNVNQNQQNININLSNLPVIEKPVYITKYRTVYVDKPQPKRVAKRLAQPVELLGYLWVYPYDLGEFSQHPTGVIAAINKKISFGRNNWRIPTPDELSVMEANANIVGLGDDIYMSMGHRNGVLRLVSTGPTYAEILEQQAAERTRQEYQNQIRQNQQYTENNDPGINVNGTIWAMRNMNGSPNGRIYFAKEPSSRGSWFINPKDDYFGWTAKASLPSGWQIPSTKDFMDLFNQGGKFDLENSCWKFGNFILPAAGAFMEKGYTITYENERIGRNMGYYVCSDGYFWFNLEKQTYGYYASEKTYRYGWRTSWTLRLIKKKNFNKYFD